MSSENTPKTIDLRGAAAGGQGGPQVERLASEAIVPGMVCSRVGEHEVKPFDAAIKGVDVLVAIEAEYMGGTLDRPYAAGETVVLRSFQPGSRYFAVVEPGESIDAGDSVSLKPGGRIAASGGPIIGVAVDTVTAGAAADGVFRCRVDVTQIVPEGQ